MARRRRELPTVDAWNSRVGLVEEYEYPRGPADAMPVHAHREVQICFSLDFPGRYAYRGVLHDVPIGSISVLDSWEPHAASDPCDRDTTAHYVMLYVDPDAIRSAVDLQPDAPVAAPVRTDHEIVGRFRALYRSLAANESALEQDERYRELAASIMAPGAPSSARAPAAGALMRARDYIAAHAAERVGLEEVATHAGLTPWHFARAFRQRFGMSPHQFQIWMRIERACRLLASGAGNAEVAHLCGFADQSHFIRRFKRMMRTTPSRYRMRVRR